MRAKFDNSIVRQHHDSIGKSDGRQSMGDNQRGPSVQ